MAEDMQRPCGEGCALNCLEPALARPEAVEILAARGQQYFEFGIGDDEASAASILAILEPSILSHEAQLMMRCLMNCPAYRPRQERIRQTNILHRIIKSGLETSEKQTGSESQRTPGERGRAS